MKFIDCRLSCEIPVLAVTALMFGLTLRVLAWVLIPSFFLDLEDVYFAQHDLPYLTGQHHAFLHRLPDDRGLSKLSDPEQVALLPRRSVPNRAT